MDKIKKRSQNYDFLYKILIELQIAIKVTPTSAKTPIHIFVSPNKVRTKTPILINNVKVTFSFKNKVCIMRNLNGFSN